MSAVDWVLLAVLLGSLLLGAWRGLVFEVLSLAGWALAFLAARAGAPLLADVLPMGASPAPLRHGAAFVLVFIGTAFGVGLLAALLRKLLSSAGLRPVDRVLGAAFGALRAALLLLVAALAVQWLGLRQPLGWDEARGARWLDAGVAALRPWLPAALGHALPDGTAGMAATDTAAALDAADSPDAPDAAAASGAASAASRQRQHSPASRAPAPSPLPAPDAPEVDNAPWAAPAGRAPRASAARPAARFTASP